MTRYGYMLFHNVPGVPGFPLGLFRSIEAAQNHEDVRGVEFSPDKSPGMWKSQKKEDSCYYTIEPTLLDRLKPPKNLEYQNQATLNSGVYFLLTEIEDNCPHNIGLFSSLDHAKDYADRWKEPNTEDIQWFRYLDGWIGCNPDADTMVQCNSWRVYCLMFDGYRT